MAAKGSDGSTTNDKSPAELLKGRVGGQQVALAATLVRANVSVELTGRASCLVTVSHLFRNPREGRPLTEGAYALELLEGDAVTGFKVLFPDKTIVGELKGREDAKREFDEAVAAGKDAALLEKSTKPGNVFECAIGRLQTLCEVKVSYLTRVLAGTAGDGSFQVVLPKQLAEFRRVARVRDPRRPPPPAQWECACGHGGNLAAWPRCAACGLPNPDPLDPMEDQALELRLAVRVSLDEAIGEVRLETRIHNQPVVKRLANEQQGEGFESSFRQNVGMSDHWCLRVVPAAASDAAQSVIMEFSSAHQSLASVVSVVPNLDQIKRVAVPASGTGGDSAAEFVFVCDCSGSMSGEKIECSKQAMQLFLRSIPGGSFVNVMRFTCGVSPLFSASQPLDQRVLGRATQFVDDMGAGGGTDILQALTDVLQRPPVRAGVSRVVFLLTDGLVSNGEQVLSFVRERGPSSDTRVYTLSLGQYAAKELCEGVARESRGQWRHVDQGGDVAKAVIELLSLCCEGKVTGLSVHFGEADGRLTAPGIVPTAYFGSRYYFYSLTPCSDAEFEGVRKQGSSTVTVRGTWVDLTGSYGFEIPVTVETSSGNGLQEGCLVNQSVAYQLILQDEAAENFGRSTEMSVKYSVVSQKTSFVAVEKPGEMQGEPEVKLEEEGEGFTPGEDNDEKNDDAAAAWETVSKRRPFSWHRGQFRLWSEEDRRSYANANPDDLVAMKMCRGTPLILPRDRTAEQEAKLVADWVASGNVRRESNHGLVVCAGSPLTGVTTLGKVQRQRVLEKGAAAWVPVIKRSTIAYAKRVLEFASYWRANIPTKSSLTPDRILELLDLDSARNVDADVSSLLLEVLQDPMVSAVYRDLQVMVGPNWKLMPKLNDVLGGNYAASYRDMTAATVRRSNAVFRVNTSGLMLVDVSSLRHADSIVPIVDHVGGIVLLANPHLEEEDECKSLCETKQRLEAADRASASQHRGASPLPTFLVAFQKSVAEAFGTGEAAPPTLWVNSTDAGSVAQLDSTVKSSIVVRREGKASEAFEPDESEDFLKFLRKSLRAPMEERSAAREAHSPPPTARSASPGPPPPAARSASPASSPRPPQASLVPSPAPAPVSKVEKRRRSSRKMEVKSDVAMSEDDLKGNVDICAMTATEPFDSTSEARYRDLIVLQQFDGTWSPQPLLLAAVEGLNLARIKDQASLSAGPRDLLAAIMNDERLMATFVALVLLAKFFGGRRVEWVLMERKAVKSLEVALSA